MTVWELLLRTFHRPSRDSGATEESRERASGGLGVGLAITKEIMDRHNGTISVESELGKGTTFSLHLPLLAQNNISVTDTLL